MATIEEIQRRLRLAIREEMKKIVAEGELPPAKEGEALFTTFENLALATGDAASLECFEQQLKKCEEGDPQCPHCGATGQRVKQRDRTLQTRRGLPVPLSEQKCYCPGCRRDFFPSVQTVGTRRGL
jgi:hypothetical protein